MDIRLIKQTTFLNVFWGLKENIDKVLNKIMFQQNEN